MQNINHSSTNDLAQELGRQLQRRSFMLVVAESCTGGGLGQAITAVPGSTQWFEGGWITYSNHVKHRWLGVDHKLLEQYGAVSKEVVTAMLQGALRQANDARYAAAITGIAGPSGGTPEKPVGLVCFAWGTQERHQSTSQVFKGSREEIRQQAIDFILNEMIKDL